MIKEDAYDICAIQVTMFALVEKLKIPRIEYSEKRIDGNPDSSSCFGNNYTILNLCKRDQIL